MAVATANLTDVLNGEDKTTVEAIAAAKHYTKTEQDVTDDAQDVEIGLKAPQSTTYTKTEVDNNTYTRLQINTSFKRSFVDLLEVSSWSFVTTTITLNVLAGHGIVATDEIWLDGLVSTTNAPNGEWTVTSVTATTIVFTATSTPTGTPTVLNAIVYKTTYTDILALGANPTAKKYHDGTVVGSTDDGKYEHNLFTKKVWIAYISSATISSGDTINLPIALNIDSAKFSNHASSNRIASATTLTTTSINIRVVTDAGVSSTLISWDLDITGELV